MHLDARPPGAFAKRGDRVATSYCTHCGCPLNRASSFCTSCGAATAAGLVNDPTLIRSRQPVGSTPPTRPRNPSQIILIASGVGLCVAVLLAAFIIMKPKSTPEPVALPSASGPTASAPIVTQPPPAVVAPAQPAAPAPDPVSYEVCDRHPYPFSQSLGKVANLKAEQAMGPGVLAAVTSVQRLLASHGYTGLSDTIPIAVDHWIGAHTEKALAQFQGQYGLTPVTGRIDARTWSTMQLNLC